MKKIILIIIICLWMISPVYAQGASSFSSLNETLWLNQDGKRYKGFYQGRVYDCSSLIENEECIPHLDYPLYVDLPSSSYIFGVTSYLRLLGIDFELALGIFDPEQEIVNITEINFGINIPLYCTGLYDECKPELFFITRSTKFNKVSDSWMPPEVE